MGLVVVVVVVEGFLMLFQTGRFGADATELVWMILAGSAIGLTAGTQGRLLGSAFYALGDTKRPLYAALVRVVLTAIAGYLFALPLREILGYSVAWGAFAITASSAFAAWVEFALLRDWLGRRIGRVPIPARFGLGVLGASLVAGAAGYGAGHLAERVELNHWASAIVAIAVFGATYLAITVAARVPEASGLVRRVLRRR